MSESYKNFDFLLLIAEGTPHIDYESSLVLVSKIDLQMWLNVSVDPDSYAGIKFLTETQGVYYDGANCYFNEILGIKF